VLDTAILRADLAMDVTVQGNLAFVADYTAGLKVLDLTDPTTPTEIGHVDTATFVTSEAVAAKDSFAYAGWWWTPEFRSFDVSEPSHPEPAGGALVQTIPEAMVLRDTFVYLAGRLRFNVVNVARPREPELVGSCVTGDATSAGLCLSDTLAYVGNDGTDVVSLRNPASPQVVGQFGRGAWNVTVRDTFAFLSSGGIVAYSISDPTHPRPLDSLSVGSGTWWIEAVGTLLYTGNRDGVRVIDAGDIHNMRVRGFAATPYTVKRLTYKSPYVYAACWEAGVSIFESTHVGLNGATATCRLRVGHLRVFPNPTTDHFRLDLAGFPGEQVSIVVRDVAGRDVMRPSGLAIQMQSALVCVASLPRGVYFVEVVGAGRRESVEFVKR